MSQISKEGLSEWLSYMSNAMERANLVGRHTAYENVIREIASGTFDIRPVQMAPDEVREALYRLDGPIASDDGMLIETGLTLWEELMTFLKEKHKRMEEALKNILGMSLDEFARHQARYGLGIEKKESTHDI